MCRRRAAYAQPRGALRVLVPGLNREHLFLVDYYRWLRGQDLNL
jgi:hypothetical protein